MKVLGKSIPTALVLKNVQVIRYIC